jgi:MEDS: MEthanogen/methylotroph, DcmR Sensory domain
MQFISAGVEIGQQVVVLAGARCLKEIARSLGDHGIRPEGLLHSGRLLFLTAPNCISTLAQSENPLQRGPLYRNGSVMRWVSDWSWAYQAGTDPSTILAYQRLVHDFTRSLSALSICTVQSSKLQRSTLFAVLADHRRATRALGAAV